MKAVAMMTPEPKNLANLFASSYDLSFGTITVTIAMH
jgi:hypothetical protein